MQILSEAANHITDEIARTRQHLVNLQQALEGITPLITADAATTTLAYAMSSKAQPIEDLSVVDAEAPAVKKTKSKSAVKTTTENTKAVKAKAAEAPVAVPEPVTKSLKLPSTGTELWLKCLGRKKVTAVQIADAALKALKLDDTARDVIAIRAKAWTYSAAKKGVLIEAGTRDGSKLYQLAPATKDKSPAQDVQGVAPVEAAVVAPATEVGDAT